MWKVAREVGRSAEQRWWWNGCMRAAQQGEGGTMDIVADVPERRVVTGVVACDLDQWSVCVRIVFSNGE